MSENEIINIYDTNTIVLLFRVYEILQVAAVLNRNKTFFTTNLI